MVVVSSGLASVYFKTIAFSITLIINILQQLSFIEIMIYVRTPMCDGVYLARYQGSQVIN
jgi:hypothetical protein